jgi:Big-like domain-containing protein
VKRLLAVPIAAVTVLAPLIGGIAYAYWDAADAGQPAAALADSLPAGSTPTATLTGQNTVTLSFPRAVTGAGRTVTDYLVRRYASSTATTAAASVGCSWPAGGALSCVDTAVPAGVWYYTTTPPIAGSGWTGAESGRSAGISTDTTPPDPPAVTSYAAVVNLANRTGLSVGGTAEAAATVTVRITDSTHTVQATTTAGTNGTWLLVGIDAGGLDDGTVSYRVSATDAAGNTSAATVLGATKDTVAPTGAVVVGSGNGSAGLIRSGGAYYVYAQAADTAPGTVGTVRADLGTVTGGQSSVPLSTTGGPYLLRGVSYPYRSAALTANTLAAGSKAVTLTVTDAAGNPTTVGGSVTVDTVAPTPASISALNRTGGVAGKPESGDTITLRWSEEMDPATLYTGWSVNAAADVAGTVTFADAGGGNGTNKDTDSFTVTGPTGVRLGTVTGIEGHLVPTMAGSYGFAATLHYAVVANQSVVTLTLGSQTAAGTVGTVPTGSTAAGSWAPTASNTDLATNTVTGTATLAAIPF